MRRRTVAAALTTAVLPLAPASATNPGVKVPCLFTPADNPLRFDPTTRTGVVTGGPWSASGPVIGMEVGCSFKYVDDPFGPDAFAPLSFFTPGLVGVLPPTPVVLSPVVDQLYLCTRITYVAFTPFDVYNSCALVPTD